MKIIHSILIIALLMLSTATMAQPGQRERMTPEEFRAKTEKFIGEKAGFTTEEAQAFFPIYHEMKGKQWQLMQEQWQLKKNKPDASATDKDYATMVAKIKNLSTEIAELEEVYYKKMCKVVPARKVFEAMQAEDRFHRQALSNFNHEKKGQRPQGHR